LACKKSRDGGWCCCPCWRWFCVWHVTCTL
jgi:hypothetical protein